MSTLNGESRSWRALEVDPTSLALAAALAAIWIGFDVASDGLFLTPRNLVNLAIQSSVVALMGLDVVLHDQVVLCARGEDAAAALDQLAAELAGGLGDELARDLASGRLVDRLEPMHAL